jgi:hypothetical protein
MQSLTDKLNILIDSLRSKGITKVDNLSPGLTRSEIEDKTVHLPFQLPEEIYELYQWRNGLRTDIPENESPFLFRDQYLLSLDEALTNYEELLQGLSDESSENQIRGYGVDLKFCFPFAGFEGSLYLIACGRQYMTDKSQHPIIQVFEDISLFFYTFSSMLDTCIEWVQHPDYTEYDIQNDSETWEKHNPGIFNS